MGAHSFTQHVPGKQSMTEAYRQADSEARHEYGNEGYNGTISTTSGCRQVEYTAMTVAGAELYASLNVDRAQKWEDALAVPTAADESFTFRTEKFTVMGNGMSEYEVREAGVTEAVRRYGTAVHTVEVVPEVKHKVVVTNTPGRPKIMFAIRQHNSWRTFDTRTEAVAAAKDMLARQGAFDPKVEIRAMKVYEDTTVAVTVERVVTKSTGKVTVTLAKLKPGVPVSGWTFFGWAAC